MQKVARNVITEGSVDSEKANLSQHPSAFENTPSNKNRRNHQYLNTEKDLNEAGSDLFGGSAAVAELV